MFLGHDLQDLANVTRKLETAVDEHQLVIDDVEELERVCESVLISCRWLAAHTAATQPNNTAHPPQTTSES
jgi:hypothetical protein